MKTKYYVRFGDRYKKVIMADNDIIACVNVFIDYFNKKDTTVIPIYFVVSERGFDIHEGDIFINLIDVIKSISYLLKDTKIKLGYKNNKFIYELPKKG